MTYLQQTLVDHLYEASYWGDASVELIGEAWNDDVAADWACIAWHHAQVALIILEHELTDDVLRDDRGIE